MARALRIQYPGAIYHVMNRGDRKEDIFFGDNDRLCFLDTLQEACEKTGWQVHAFCLMRNHFHLMVETPQPNLAMGMKWLLATYSTRFNKRHQLCGHVFSGRYKAPLVDGSGTGYLRTAAEYIHLNPVRAKLLRDDEPLSEYKWSSFPAYLGKDRPAWLRVDRVLGECGIPRDTAAGRKRFQEVMEARRFEADAGQYKALRRGWMLGSPEFRREMLEQAFKRIGPNHFGTERREAAETLARQIISETLRREGLTRPALQELEATHPVKTGLARELRGRTTMDLKWVAAELGVGSWKYLSNLLRSPAKAGPVRQGTQ